MSDLFAPASAVPDLYITDELDRRPPKVIDREFERRALRDLLSRMSDAPGEVLPRLVDLAMELTGGASAGLSLYEPAPSPGQFRWRHLQGSLSPFEDATTPRNHSPCGVTLDCNAPTLSLHPERFYSWISDADIVVPEVLLVPLRVQGGEPLGTLWIVAEHEGHFTRDHANSMAELAWYVGVAVRMLRDREELQTALEEQQTLTREMGHRVKNLFAVTDGMIRLTERSTNSTQEMAQVLSGRLQALANAHALVSRHLHDVGRAPRVSDLETVVHAILAPHVAAKSEAKVTVAGPSIECGDHAINGLALVLHELATNALKYGALSSKDGAVGVSWQEDGEFVVMKWVETGGVSLDEAPGAEGFGSGLVRRTVVSQFGGSIDYAWARAGLTVTMTLNRSRISG